jgi:hypothetical protein
MEPEACLFDLLYDVRSLDRRIAERIDDLERINREIRAMQADRARLVREAGPTLDAHAGAAINVADDLYRWDGFSLDRLPVVYAASVPLSRENPPALRQYRPVPDGPIAIDEDEAHALLIEHASPAPIPA